jgi:hypothetical protein
MADLIHTVWSGMRKIGLGALLEWLLPLPFMASTHSHRLAAVRQPVRGVMLCIALWTIGLGLGPAHAALNDGSNATVEQRVKAASLYRFIGYVEWPPPSFATETSPYVVGVVSADETADELWRISAGRNVNNRAIVVRKLKAGESLAGIHMLFIGRDERGRQPQWLQLAQEHPVLTVTETEGALAQGSMINFRLADERVRFEVSLDAVEKSDVRISSRILSVALSVSKGARQ